MTRYFIAISIVLGAIVCVAANSLGATLAQRVDALIDATPQLVVSPPSEPANNPNVRYRWVTVHGAQSSGMQAGGFLNPAGFRDGHLEDGREVVIVGLDSGTNDGLEMFALIYARINGTMRYVAFIDPGKQYADKLSVSLSGGYLEARSAYGAPEACNPFVLHRIFAIDQSRLRMIRSWTEPNARCKRFSNGHP